MVNEREAQLARVDAWWRASNYLSVGQIYLLDNPLLREPLVPEHVKPRLLGHWGTTPGLNFVWSHLNRAIVERDQEVLFVTGPGHGGPAVVAQAWMEGTYSEVYPGVGRDAAGLQTLMRQFSFPGGIPSHAAPETPGSMNEGGELGTAWRTRTAPRSTTPTCWSPAWSATARPRPGPWPRAGTRPSSSTRAPTARCCRCCTSTAGRSPTRPSWPGSRSRSWWPSSPGYGFRPYLFTAGADEDHASVHARMADLLDEVLDEVRRIQDDARSHDGPFPDHPRAPAVAHHA